MKTINAAGLNLIKQFEGLVDGDPNTPGYDPYLDPVGIWTIGYGHAIRNASGHFIKGTANRERAQAIYPNGLSKEEVDALLAEDVAKRERSVARMTEGVKLNSNQFSALVSFVFNIGETNFLESTMLRKLRAGDFEGAAAEFPRWKYADGKELEGLVRRREAERQLFLKEVKPLARSRTIVGAAVAAVGGAAGLADIATEATVTLGEAVKKVEPLGLDLTTLKIVIGVVTLAGAGFALYARINDHIQGRK